MGCAASTIGPSKGGDASGSTPPKDETPQQREFRLKAEESAKRLAAMKAEIEAERVAAQSSFVKAAGTPLVAALQRQWYGITLPMAKDQYQPFLRATMSVAAADHVNETEGRWIRDRTLLLGLNEEQVQTLFKFDYRMKSVEQLLKTFNEADEGVANGSGHAAPTMGTPVATQDKGAVTNGNSHAAPASPFNIRRVILYDALTMASQDMYTLDERARASSVAELLRLGEEELEEIKAIVSAEDELRRRKQELFAVAEESFDSGPAATSGLFGFLSLYKDNGQQVDARDIEARPRRNAFHRLIYGTEVPLAAVEYSGMYEQYVAVLLAVAGAEGVVTTPEKVRDTPGHCPHEPSCLRVISCPPDPVLLLTKFLVLLRFLLVTLFAGLASGSVQDARARGPRRPIA